MIPLTFCIGLLVMWCEDPKQTVTRGWCQVDKQLELQNRKEGRRPISQNSLPSDKANHLAKLKLRDRICPPTEPVGR